MYWEAYAFISDNEVMNIAVFSPSGYTDACNMAMSIYGESATAVNVSQYPVQIGDRYIDGEFRRYAEDGTYTVVEYIPTDSEKIQSLKSENEELALTMDTILTEIIPSITGA